VFDKQMIKERKRICIITGSRSEYGLMRWIMNAILYNPNYILQLIVTGTHLSKKFGETYKEIIKDGFEIDAKIEMDLSKLNTLNIAKAMGQCAIGVSKKFSKLKPDILLVLGDRYELLPICGSALVMSIPIAHFSGGDKTEGAIDDQIRNAISMMSTYHFPGNKDSARKLLAMGIPKKNIFMVGEPGLENFKKLNLYTKDELAEKLELDIQKPWVLLTYHPETKISLVENLNTVKNIFRDLEKLKDINIICTYANADFGGDRINNLIDKYRRKERGRIFLFANLGQKVYLSLLKNIFFMIGNSSSGIVEAPFIGCPVINVGDRQKGRYLSKNIIQTSNSLNDIKKAVQTLVYNCETYKNRNKKYFGDGEVSKRTLMHLEEIWKRK